MKKVLKYFSCMLAFLALGMISSFSAKAEDCSKAVDKIVSGYNDIANKMASASSAEELFKIDFFNDMQKAADTADESCYTYQLTDSDKANLIKAFDNVMYTLIARGNDLTDGEAQEMLGEQLQNLIDIYHGAISGTETLGDYVEVMTRK